MTPDTIEAQYLALRTTRPFRKWGLPDPDDIAFCVLASRDRMGHFRGAITGPHEIGISMRRVGTIDTLIRVLAHEMIHLFQELTKTTTANTEHNAAFRRISAEVARHHCFDPKEL